MVMFIGQSTEHDMPERYNDLTPDQKEELCVWIDCNLTQITSINKKCTSYGLKHFFEASSNGFYIPNGAFKGAMLAVGFRVADRGALNWHFNVSAKSVRLLYEWSNRKHN